MRKLLALILILNISITTLESAHSECINQVCVDVSSDPTTNQIIITANKPGSSTTHSPTPRPLRTSIRKPNLPKPNLPKAWIPWLPRTSSPTPRPHRTYKKVSTAALAERFTQLIPQGAIHVQPVDPLLVNEPVNFWSDVPDEFAFNAVVLGVAVRVKLKPSFTWEFGDGATDIESGRGAPFPLDSVHHRYLARGPKSVKLHISWSGTAWIEGIPAPIPGGLITHIATRDIEIFPAHTFIARH
jgi:hypothetical protein